MRILNYAVYTRSKYLRILNYAVYTRAIETIGNCDFPFESVEKRRRCVWVPCQSNTHVLFTFPLHVQRARGIIGGSG